MTSFVDFFGRVTVLALLVLAAACANLASLFAARTADRSHELALRVALGSSGGRLVRQLLTEAVILSLLGGAAGLSTAYLLLGVLDRWQSPYGHLEISVDVRVYLAALAFTLGSAFLFGMVPARQAWHSSPLQAIKSGPMESLPLRRFALRDLLLGVQIAICTLLVTASLVAVRGMVRDLHAPLGIQPQGAMLVNVGSDQTIQPVDQAIEKQREILEAARTIPGVTAVGSVSRTPMTGGMRGVPIFPPGTTDFKLDNSVLAPYVFPMSPGYLEAAGTRLLSGRDLSWHDTAKTPHVAIVNETFVRKMWGQTPGDRAALCSERPPDRSGGRGRRRQIPRPARVAAASGLSAVRAKRHKRRGLRGAVATAAERDGIRARTHPEQHRSKSVHLGAELARCLGRL